MSAEQACAMPELMKTRKDLRERAAVEAIAQGVDAADAEGIVGRSRQREISRAWGAMMIGVRATGCLSSTTASIAQISWISLPLKL